MAFEMSVAQQTTVTAKFTDKFGNPAAVDGVPEWVSDNNLLALKPAQDGKSCVVGATGGIGSATLTMTADADMGSGVVPIIGTMDINLTAGQATTVELTAAPPTDRLEVTPTTPPSGKRK